MKHLRKSCEFIQHLKLSLDLCMYSENCITCSKKLGIEFDSTRTRYFNTIRLSNESLKPQKIKSMYVWTCYYQMKVWKQKKSKHCIWDCKKEKTSVFSFFKFMLTYQFDVLIYKNVEFFSFSLFSFFIFRKYQKI